MKIKDNPSYQLKSRPITFLATDKVQDALNVMCEKNIGSIVVTHPDHTVAGIVTERDMMIRVLGEKRNPENTLLSDIMTEQVQVAKENDDLLDWMQIMSNDRFRHLPIVSDSGQLLKMMSQGDFVAFTNPDLYEKVRQDLKGRLGKYFPFLLVLFSAITIIGTLSQ